MTTLSIVTVVLNDLPGLTKTAGSLASQKQCDVEWIVVDGASLPEHQPQWEDIPLTPEVFISEADSGIYDAMNKGWGRATGEWVLFLNAGDTLCQERTLEDVIPRLERTTADWAFGMVRNVNSRGNVVGIQNASPFNRMGHALGNTTVPHQATFMRRRLISDLNGFDAQFGTAADQELIYRAARLGSPLELVWPIADFRLDGRGMQVAPAAHISAMRKARARHRDRFLGNVWTDSAATAVLLARRTTEPWLTRLRD